MLRSDPKPLQKKIPFRSVSALDQALRLSRSVSTIFKMNRWDMNLKQVTYQIFLPLCSASTDSLQILSCWTWSCSSDACLSAPAQVADCAITGRLGGALPRDADGPEAGCPRSAVTSFFWIQNRFSQVVHFETHCIPTIFMYIVTVKKVKPAIICTFKSPSLALFFLAADLECFQKRKRSWQAVLSTGLLPSLMLIFYCFMLLVDWMLKEFLWLQQLKTIGSPAVTSKLSASEAITAACTISIHHP